MKINVQNNNYLALLRKQVLFFFLLFVAGSAWGQIASLELGTTSYSGNSTGAATFTSKDANITSLPALSLTASQQGQAGGAGYVSSKAWNNASQTTTTYWSFTLAANSGFAISVTSIVWKGARSGTGPTSYAIRSSVDGYTTNLATSTTSGDITFSSIGITNQSSVTFRIYGWGGSAATGTWRCGDGSASSADIAVNGSVNSTNAAPTATGVSITGTPTNGQVLTGNYTYADAESNPQGTSTFKWYRANDAAGTGEAAISGATASTYTLVAGDVGKYIRFGVVPIASAGTTTGTETFSSRVGPIALDAIQSNGTGGGDWASTATWQGGAVPGASDKVVILASDVVYTSAGLTRNVATTVNGKFQINNGGFAGGSTDFTYGAAGELIFNHGGNNTYGPIDGNHKYWPATSGPVSVTINGSSPINVGVSRTVTNLYTSSPVYGTNAITVNGTNQMNSTAVTFDQPVVYGASTTLIYNSGSTFTRGNEWNNSPANVTLQNSTTLNYPSNWGSFTRTLTGNLTIGASSALYMDYGSPATGVGALTVGGTFTNNGNVSLGNANGGDLYVKGNFVNTTGTSFDPKGRAVFFNGTTVQTITGATTFAYLFLDNASGLTLGGSTSSITVSNNLTLTTGKITLGSNNLTVSGTISGSSASNYIVTNGTGQLKQTVAGSAVAFPVGSATVYNPITFTNAGTSDVYGVIVTSGTVPNVQDAAYTVNDIWKVSEAVAGGSTLTVVPQWNTGDQGSSFASGTQAYVGFYDGTSWTQNTATVSGANPYTATGASAFTPTALAGTQYFAVGKDNGFKCGAMNVPYTQNFESSVVPAIPTCNSIQNAGTGNNWITSSNPGNGFTSKTLQYNYHSTNPANAWFFTQGVNLTAGTSYRISYKYGNNSVTLIEKLKVAYGSTANSVAMTNALADHTAITGGSASTNAVDFIPSSSGVYYFGFNAHSDTDQYYLYVDDISVIVSPPTLLVNNTSSATLSFGSNEIGSAVTPQTFSLTGANLTGAPSNITVTAPTDFQVSSDGGTTWGSTAMVAYTTATLSAQNISVKYIPTSCGNTSSGNVTFSGGGVSAYPTVAVSGTATLAKPASSAGTDITASTFTANWAAVTGATGYELEVSTSSTFGTSSAGSVSEGFNSSTPNLPTGYSASAVDYTFGSGVWSLTNIIKTTTDQNAGAQGLQLKASGGTFTSPNFNSPTTLTFYAKRGSNATTLVVNKIINGVTTQIASQALTTTMTLYTVNVNDTSSNVKLQFVNGSNVAYVDDFNISYSAFTPSFVTGYNPKVISGGSTVSQLVSGLDINTTYYYRVRATSGACSSINSDVKTVLTNNSVVWNNNAWTNTTGPTSTLDAVIKTPYYVGNSGQPSFEVKNLTLESTGLLKIKAGQGVTINGDITTPDNKIIIQSDGSLVQTKLTNGNSNNLAIAKRNVNMRTSDYTYWSSPLKDQILLNTTNVNAANSSGGFSPGTPNNRTYHYNEVDDTFRITADATFTSGKGYAIRGKSGYGANLAIDSLAFSGNLNNGNYTIQIQKSKNTLVNNVSTEHGYNLIGNPYPSNIDFYKFYNLDHGDGTKNSDLIYGKAWFWSNTSPVINQSGSAYSGNNYAILTLAGGVPGTGTGDQAPNANEFIKMAQGFIVQMNVVAPTGATPTTGTLKFDNSIRTNDSTGHFYNNKSSQQARNRYWLSLTSPENIVNTILLAHLDGAINGYDSNYDAELLTVGDDSFYSKLNTQKLQIQARSNPLNVEDVIPLGTKYSMNGVYKIALREEEGVFATGQKVYLKDHTTGSYTDLTSQDYTFIASKGTDETRFEIVYKDNAVLATDGVKKSDFTVYRDGEYFVIKSSSNLGRVELYDVSGKLITSKSVSQKELRLDAATISTGVYIIKAENSGNVRTKKIIK